MSFKLGNTTIGELYVGSNKIAQAYLGSNLVYQATAPVDPYNPLGLPANTIRCKFKSGYTPNMGDSRTIVDAGENIWDIYKQSNDWTTLFRYNVNLLEVLGANTTNVTIMQWTFNGCTFSSVPLFDTSNTTDMSYMFQSCTALTAVPLLNTSKATTMSYMFSNCQNVQSGALALYQQASSQATPPKSHAGTFMNCGKNTQTGAAELAQIPDSWKN